MFGIIITTIENYECKIEQLKSKESGRNSRKKLKMTKLLFISLCFLCPLWLYSLRLCVFVAKNPFNQRNLRLINDLRAYKPLYNCKETFTDVMKTLQIKLFMQNKANFRKVKFNVNKVLTRDYEQMDTWSIRKTKPIQSQLKPIQSQLKPIKANSKPIKANSKPIKANKMPKQTQPVLRSLRRSRIKSNLSRRSLWRSRNKAKQIQFQGQYMLPRMTINPRRSVEESPIHGIAILLIIKTGPGPIYKHSTCSTIKQYIVNVINESFLAKDQELFWVPASGPNDAEPGGNAKYGITRAKEGGHGR
jgi:hypothetical protein